MEIGRRFAAPPAVLESGMRPEAARLLVAVLAAGACSSDNEPHGSPVLTQVRWSAGNSSALVWSLAADPAVTTGVSPAAGEIDFVFDRRLDGSRIEDTVNGPSGPREVAKADPPITVSWADQASAMSVPPFSDRVLYNSAPIYGGESAYVFVQPVEPGFPSLDTVTFTLDKGELTSAYGDPMTGPDHIDVRTGAFTAAFQLPVGADGSTSLPADFMLPLAFSNRPAPVAAVAPYVRATAAGRALPIALAVDGSDTTVIFVSPASCLGGWPAGVAIQIEVAAGLPDAFGSGLSTAVVATFTASGGPVTASDGGCGAADAALD